MLVPLMTIEEIRREINKDFPIVFRKMGYVAQKLKKKFVQFFDYYSKYKNNR